MTERLILAIDQGTSGTTCLMVTPGGEVRARAHREVPVRHPRPGWVEQDAGDLYATVVAAGREAMAAAESVPVAIGIANQRETLVVFDRRTLEPVAPAIVWQCRRSQDLCTAHRDAGEEAELRRRTGLLLDPYFTATKIEWLLRERPDLRTRAGRGELCAGTVDTWLVARLTGGEVIATDAGNAARTLLHSLGTEGFDADLAARFDVPMALLAEVRPSAGRIGLAKPGSLGDRAIPISGLAGDQQAALFGQACVVKGMSKNTYGTGSFVLANAGATPPDPGTGLLSTVAWRIGTRDTFALEGSIFVTGAAINWLRDGLELISTAGEVEALFNSVPDGNGCHFVPALSGLGAPYWDPGARGALLGLTAGVKRAHVVRAVVEAMAHRTRDVIEAMEAVGDLEFPELRVDGGASVMDGLCQFQSDQLGIPVARAAGAEITGIGAALLAAVGEELIAGPEAVAAAWRPGRRFLPEHPGGRPAQPYAAWRDAVNRVRSYPA